MKRRLVHRRFPAPLVAAAAVAVIPPAAAGAATTVGSTFLCKLDRKAFAKCRSPRTHRNLKPGKHRFQVKARDEQGNLDPSPVVRKFKIKT